jgi:hypothetical protein
MTPHQEILLQTTHDSTLRTEGRVQNIYERLEAVEKKTAHLQRWHWTMHGIGLTLLGIVSFFQSRIMEVFK